MEDSREDIPRIAVDTFEDLERIRADFTNKMMAVLEQKLAQRGAEEAVGDAVKAHLLAWRDKTFDLAKPNLRINGMNYEDHVIEADESEPFDETLDRKIWALNEEKIAWDKTLADRRRKAPLEVQRLMEDLLVRQRVLEEVPDAVADDEEMEELSRLPRHDEIEKTHLSTLSLMEDLRTKVPVILDKVANIKRVNEDMAKLEP